MKSIITIIALVIMASPSFAATTKKSAKKTNTTSTTNTAATTDSTNTYTSKHTNNDSIDWQAGLGLGTAGSEFHFGVIANGLVPVAKTEVGDILVGGQTGFLYSPGTTSGWIIPIMAEGQFNFKNTNKLTPYAGLSMGVAISHSSYTSPTYTFGGTTIGGTTASGTDTSFAMLVKGGVFFGNDGKYYAELPLGTMGSAFAIFPTVGMKF